MPPSQPPPAAVCEAAGEGRFRRRVLLGASVLAPLGCLASRRNCARYDDPHDPGDATAAVHEHILSIHPVQAAPGYGNSSGLALRDTGEAVAVSEDGRGERHLRPCALSVEPGGFRVALLARDLGPIASSATAVRPARAESCAWLQGGAVVASHRAQLGRRSEDATPGAPSRSRCELELDERVLDIAGSHAFAEDDLRVIVATEAGVCACDFAVPTREPGPRPGDEDRAARVVWRAPFAHAVVAGASWSATRDSLDIALLAHDGDGAMLAYLRSEASLAPPAWAIRRVHRSTVLPSARPALALHRGAMWVAAIVEDRAGLVLVEWAPWTGDFVARRLALPCSTMAASLAYLPHPILPHVEPLCAVRCSNGALYAALGPTLVVRPVDLPEPAVLPELVRLGAGAYWLSVLPSGDVSATAVRVALQLEGADP